jgi:methionyl aminopeptidase
VTGDGRLSAQFEHTVAVTRGGVDVLTLRRDERPMLECAV